MSLCGTDKRQTNKQVKIELLSRWKLEAEFRNSGRKLSWLPRYLANMVSYWALVTPPFSLIFSKHLQHKSGSSRYRSIVAEKQRSIELSGRSSRYSGRVTKEGEVFRKS